MKIFVVVVSYNSKNDLPDCLNAIDKIRSNNLYLKTIVVDNASSDNSVVVARQFGNVEIIESRENVGFAGGNNLGIKKAIDSGADWILVLNPDTKVSPNIINEFLKVQNKDKLAGILAPKIYFWPGFEFYKKKYNKNDYGKVIWYAGGIIDWKNILASHRGIDEVDNGQYDVISETDFASGAAMFINANVFEKAGFFDERYFLYFDDVEFCQRAKLSGFRVVFVPKAIVWHKWAQSTGGGSDIQDYFITRNRLLFGLNYSPVRTKIALFRQSISFLFKERSKRLAVIDFLRANFGKGSLDQLK
ncbi:MAG: glycosyltransferase family 2 protein [Nitrososphaerota archaeon]